MFAAANGHWDVELVETVVWLLLEHGADPNVIDDGGQRALDITARDGKLTIVTHIEKYKLVIVKGKVPEARVIQGSEFGY